MDRSPALQPTSGGGNNNSAAAGGTGNVGINANGNNAVSTSSSNINTTPSVTPGKPSLSQQILRTFRPRASVTAAPFVSSATASPMARAIDQNGIAGTQILSPIESEQMLVKPSTNVPDANLTITGITPQQGKAAASLSLDEYRSLLKDLRNLIPAKNGTSSSQTAQERDVAFQYALSATQTLYAAIKTVTEAEEAANDAEDVDWNTHQMIQPGPPQAEVFRTCLLLLTQAKAGLLPLAFCLSICELVTASVHLSDLRANRATKAARETRSGAPGSQSSKALDADPPLANIDRAALYALVCHLSDHTRGNSLPSKENQYETRSPALPMQLRALEVLSYEGRDVASFPGLLEFLGDGLLTSWEELQVLRRISSREIVEGTAKDITPEQHEEQTMILEQLTLREWTVLSSLHMITSIIKFSFSKLDLGSVEDVLTHVADMMHNSKSIAYKQPSKGRTEQQEGREVRKARSKSKERRPLTEGYDYYGLDTLNQSDTPTPSATPLGGMTPRMGPSVNTTSAGTSVAPIALATVPPVSSIGAAAAAALAKSDYKSEDTRPILQETDVRAVIKLIDSTLRFGFMPPRSVNGVTSTICCILGHHIVTPNKESDWSELANGVLANLLRSHCANASIRCARQMLMEDPKEHDHEIVLLCGAVEFLRGALLLVAQSEEQKGSNAAQTLNPSAKSGSSSKEDVLAPYITVPLLIPALAGALRRHADVLDIQVLNLVSQMLPLKDGRHILGRRLTQDDWDLLLDLPGIAKRHLHDFHNKLGRHAPSSHTDQIETSTPAVIEAMLNLVSRLRLSNLRAVEEGKESGKDLPWTPKLAFLLLSLAPFLPDEIIVDLVEYYKARHLCLPCTTDWIPNVRSLLNALFHRHELLRSIKTNGSQASRASAEKNGNLARTTLVKFLFEHVYETVQDLPQHRSALLLGVILPLAQSALASESDPFVETTMRHALIDAAVTAISTTGAAASQYDEDNASLAGSVENVGSNANEEESSGDAIFNEIIGLHEKLARSETSNDQLTKDPASASANQHVSFADPPGSHEHKTSSRTHSRNSSASNVFEVLTNTNQKTTAATDTSVSIKKSKAIQSSLDLIAIFQRLAFSSPWVLLPTSSRAKKQSEKAQRLAWEKRARTASLAIFRILLDLIKPATPTTTATGAGEASATAPVSGQSAASTSVRLAILQWLVRLRTDREHRIYIVGDIQDLIAPAANTLRRGPLAASNETEVEATTSTADPNGSDRTRSTTRRDTNATRDGGRDPNRSRSSAAERSASRIREASRERERGRREQTPGYNNENASGAFRLRSPSRTRNPVVGVASSIASGSNSNAPINRKNADPLWRLPEQLLFDVPPIGWRSDVVFTYMHPETDRDAHHHHHHRYASMEEGGAAPIPMPISEYLATCINLLTQDKEWDLISYLLSHLPHQLANKHLVCGPKAQKQVLALRQILTSQILDQKFINQVSLPDDVKKSDVYAVAYGTLATLISYRALFSRSQQDELVEAFMAGLNKSSNTAQPCIRALTVACYELQKSINRHLPKMLVKMTTVMSSSTMSVHILEMIAAIGSLPSLYANFTETDYRRIFGIALQYIQYHNQRSAEEDARSSATAFTLSQYVIMLAYYNISLWFLIVKLPDRIKYVESIRKGLLLANEGRTRVADQTEVCFDFLARYTHSNAEPRPQQSFLNHIVKAKGQSVHNTGSASTSGPSAASNSNTKHFLYGKGLLSISTLDKNGWAEILVRRPSGTMGLLCKLENVPISHLPDEDEEEVDLPAAMMMNRNTKPEITSPGQNTLAAWVREKLHEHEMQSSQRPLGPPRHDIARRPRSSSFTLDQRNSQAKITFKERDIDAYTTATEGDISHGSEHGLLQPESEELKATMKRVLADTTSDGQGLTVTEKSKDAPGSDATAVPTTSSGTITEKNASGEQVTNSAVKARPANARNEHAFDPGFLALQLSAYPDVSPSNKPPLLLPNEPWVQRMVRAVDLTPTVDFHRIGVLYVGAGQRAEKEILANRNGSNRYAQFLRGLGDLITLRGQTAVYTGGLDTHNDEHGKYAYVWGDDISQIVYHTTTLMPNDEVNDPMFARKKALIGNDWVRIIWNESGLEYDPQTIRTQFNYVSIVISPNSRGGAELGSVNAVDTIFYRVSLQCIEGLPNFAPVGDGQLVSAAVLPNFVRILALHCSLVSQIFVATGDRQSGQSFNYTSNWVSRLQHLERARTKIESETAKAASSETATDSTPTNETRNEDQTTSRESGGRDEYFKNTPKVVSASDATAYNILRF